MGAEGCVRPGSGYRIVQKTHNRTKPVKSAVVIFDDNIQVIENQILTTENVAVATLRTDVWEISVISVYMEGSQEIEPYIEHIKKVKTYLKTPNIILGGDVNAWSTWWGSEREDHRGEALASALGEMGLEILNEGDKPTFFVANQHGIRKSVVDITTCTEGLLGLIRGWKVEEGITSSDHNTVAFSIVLKTPMTDRPTKTTRKFNTKKADWQIFKKEFKLYLIQNRLNLEEIKLIDNIETLRIQIKTYIEGIEVACQKSMPPKIFKTVLKLPWWNANLENLKKKLKTKKRRVAVAAPTRRPHVVEEYLAAKEVYEQEVSAAQISSWKSFCQAQDRETVWDGIYRVLRNTQPRQEDQPLVLNQTALTPHESVELLAKTFFPQDDEDVDKDCHKKVRRKADSNNATEETGEDRDPPFTHAELSHALHRSNPKKAPGGDGFTADICRQAVGVNSELFLCLLNKCLELSFFPEPWKEAVVVVLRKPGKDDYTQPKSYRPIGLLSVLGKVLERMMVRRIRWHVLRKANRRQYGFTPQRSTEDALYDLVNHLRVSLDKKLINLVISLDIEGAFDSAWWPAIRCQLAEKGCPKNLRRLVDSYLKDRRVSVRYADNEHSQITTKGCIQGSISGPTFWNVLLDPLLNEVAALGVHVQAFADDIVLVISGDSGTQISVKAQQVLSRVHEWGIESKLKFAPHKTYGMIVTRKMKYDTPFVHMGGTPIKLVTEIKILGVNIDDKLNFNNHVKIVCKKAINIYRVLARSAKISWGLRPEIIRTMYTAVIEPIVLYAASVWASEARKICIRKCLDTVQRGFAQKIIKSYRTVSLDAALALSGLIPLDLRAREVAGVYEAKRGKPQDFLHGRTVERRIAYSQTSHPSEELEVRFGCVENLEPESVESHDLRGMVIYTDGSKIADGVGAALTCWKGEAERLARKYVLSSFCTVFQAELFALYQATKIAVGSSEQTVRILSDSRSALELLGDQDASHPIAFFIKENLKRAKKENKDVKLFWVKAHAGIPGNERADELAKNAAQNTRKAPDYDECPISYIKRKAREATVETWNNRYVQSEKGKTTKVYLPTVTDAYRVLKSVKLTPTLTQALTGHGGYGEYLAKYKLKDSAECECDSQKRETIIHLLTDCPILSRARMETEQKMNTTISEEKIKDIVKNKKHCALFMDFCIYVTTYSLRKNGSTNV